jgi:hypothetical protein
MSDGNDFNARNIAEFRANHGRVSGPFEGARSSSCTPSVHAAGSRGPTS